MLIEKNIITSKICGNLKNIEFFIDSLNNSNDSRAWILEGPKGVGKAALIKLISSIILNISKNPLLSNNETLLHPDLFILEKVDDKKNIPVDQIRKLKFFFSKTSFGDIARIAIIDSVNDLNNYGHNAILKIIEEPPKNSFIFIINHLTTIIPATIKSRCKSFKLRELKQFEVSSFLADKINFKDKALLETYSLLSNGSIGNAIDFFNNNAIDLYTNLCIYFKDLGSFDDKTVNAFINSINMHKNKNNLILIFFYLLEYFINKVIKTKAFIKQNYCDDNEKLAIKYFSEAINLNNLFKLKDNINNYYNNFYLLNTDLHSTLYSLLIEIHNNILESNNATK